MFNDKRIDPYRYKYLNKNRDIVYYVICMCESGFALSCRDGYFALFRSSEKPKNPTYLKYRDCILLKKLGVESKINN
jgi:hypothetical protein